VLKDSLTKPKVERYNRLEGEFKNCHRRDLGYCFLEVKKGNRQLKMIFNGFYVMT